MPSTLAEVRNELAVVADVHLKLSDVGGYLMSRAGIRLDHLSARVRSRSAAAKCFGYVQTYDQKPRRRLWELMKFNPRRYTSHGACSDEILSRKIDTAPKYMYIHILVGNRLMRLLIWTVVKFRKGR